jgi:23S rRNA pseudouridine1911/1915/1917 synthase
MQPKIVFEDKYLLIINKPPGWIVNEAKTTKGKPVIQSWLKKNKEYEIVTSRKMRSGIVHRIDKQTSGILIVAKNKDAFENIQTQFKERKVKKTYLALLHGKLVPDEGSVEAPVGRLPWNRERFGVLPGGRKALTKYKVENYFKKEKDAFSLVEFYPKTGRTHQIRIHAKYLNHPIVSDSFYAGRKTSRSDKKWCPRLFLHALKIEFNHPKNMKNVSFKSELPEDLTSVIKLLKVI